MTTPPCVTGRRRYRTVMAAALAVDEVDRRGRVKKGWTWCKYCRGYHLTKDKP